MQLLPKVLATAKSMLLTVEAWTAHVEVWDSASEGEAEPFERQASSRVG